MLREKSTFFTRAHRVLDVGVSAGAFILAYLIKLYLLPDPFRGLTVTPNYYIVLLLIIIIWYICFNFSGMYVSYRTRTVWAVLRDMVKAVFVAVLILLFFIYVFKISNVSRMLLAVFFLLNVGLLAASKGIVYKTLERIRKQGLNFRSVLIVGSRGAAKDVIDTIGPRLNAGFRILGCLDSDRELVGSSVKNGVKVIGTFENIEALLSKEVVDELIFARPLKEIENADQYIFLAEKMGVSVRIVPDWQIHNLIPVMKDTTMGFQDFLGIPTMSLTSVPQAEFPLFVKGTIDLIFGGLALIVFSPVMALIALGIKMVSPGPVIFRQERCGLNGRKFTLLKFRTMAPDAEAIFEKLKSQNEVDGPVFKIKKDPRIIPYIGTVLRKSGLDELPQLINVLRGEMSLVGPRPPIPGEVEKYEIWQRRRLSMKPGLTCLWQCTERRNDIEFEEWMKLDLKYIDCWSLWLDLKILFRTVSVVFWGQGR